jgi:hypothetical protein
MQKRSIFLRFKRELASFSLVRFSFSSNVFSLRTRFIFSLVSGSLSSWSPIQFLFGFIFSWVQFSFSSGSFSLPTSFIFSLVSGSLSPWSSIQFLFGFIFSWVRLSFSLVSDSVSLRVYFIFVPTWYKEKIDRIQRENEPGTRRK